MYLIFLSTLALLGTGFQATHANAAFDNESRHFVAKSNASSRRELLSSLTCYYAPNGGAGTISCGTTIGLYCCNKATGGATCLNSKENNFLGSKCPSSYPAAACCDVVSGSSPSTPSGSSGGSVPNACDSTCQLRKQESFNNQLNQNYYNNIGK